MAKIRSDSKKTQVLLLAGGYGTRLKPFTLSLPKPVVPFVSRPILEHLIRLLKFGGFYSHTALLLYRPEKITSYFKDGKNLGVHLNYFTALQDFGTAGAVKSVHEQLKSTFLVVSGDVITDVNIADLLEFHKSKGGMATLMLARVHNPLPFGLTIIDDKNRIQRFVEKPSTGELITDLVNGGIYVLEPDILQYIPQNQPFLFARDLFPFLLNSNIPMYGYVHSGYWQDIGDLRQYLTAHHDYLNGKFNLPDDNIKLHTLNAGNHVRLGRGVESEGTVLVADNCSISEGVRLVRSVIGANVAVGAGAEIIDSVIWSNVKIGAGSRLVSDVITYDNQVGEHVYFEDNVFVGEGCEIGDLTTIKSNVKIWPGKKIASASIVSSSMIWGDRWLRELFSGSKIRGIINQEVSPEFGAKLGAAFGSYLGKSGYVLVSWDGTLAARMINRAIICGLMSAGVNVGDLRVTPVPIMRYALKNGTEKGGVHVRRVQNQENFIEILFFEANGQNISANCAKAVERLFLQEDFSRAGSNDIGKLDFPVRFVESYQERYLQHLNITEIEKARFKIVVDYSFGPASLILPTILGSLDCEVVALNAYPDSKRITGRWVDFRYALLQLGSIVVSLKADAGFLIDASTERLFVVDESGHYLRNEYLLALITKLYLQAYHPKTISTSISAPSIVRDLVTQYKSKIIDVSHDLRSIGEHIQKNQPGFVGDIEGQFIFPGFQFASDGMFALGKILELLAVNRTRLKELRSVVPEPIISKRKVSCSGEHVGTILRKIMDIPGFKIESTLDGVKFEIPGGWILLSPSQDELAIILIAEGESREDVNNILTQFSKHIEELNKEIS